MKVRIETDDGQVSDFHRGHLCAPDDCLCDEYANTAEDLAFGHHFAKKYRTIVVDPPWRYRKGNQKRPHGRRWAEDVYPTMTNEAILTLPVKDWAEADAHLYLWVTNPRLYGERDDDSITPHDMLKEWGFKYKTMLTWAKPNYGMGSYFRGQTEHVLFGVRGDLRIAAADRKSNIFRGATSDHSAKPDAFYDLVESVSPSPRLDVFARRRRLGWDAWGNEWYDTPGLPKAVRG